MVIFGTRPWEAATFASHDDGSLFREETGDEGLVRPLGNGILFPVRRVVYFGVKRIICSLQRQKHQVGVKSNYEIDSIEVVGELTVYIMRGVCPSRGFLLPPREHHHPTLNP